MSRRQPPDTVPVNETWGRVVGSSLAVVTCLFLGFAAGFSTVDSGVPWFGWAAVSGAAIVVFGLSRFRWRHRVTRWTVVAMAAALPALVVAELAVDTWRELSG